MNGDLLPHIGTIGLECVGIWELPIVTVARAGKYHDSRPGGHLDITDAWSSYWPSESET